MNAPAHGLPDLATPYHLPAGAAAQYQRDGHILLRAVCTPQEIAAYRPMIVDAVGRYNTEVRPLHQRDTYGKAFLQIMNLWEHDAAVRQFVLARRFAQIAADLMGVDRVRLYHDQALFKEPGGGPTPWHQDQYYWPLDTDHTITMWMPLVEVSEQMGTMTFASGSHREGYLGPLEISDASDQYFRDFVHARGYPLVSCGRMAPGDASFHSGWTLHCAPGNRTDQMRQAMTIIYFADGARILEPDNKNRVMDLQRWLPGQHPGELAASPLNPIVYDRGTSG